MISIDLTEAEVDKVLRSQRAEIEALKNKLRKINEHVVSLAGVKAELPTEFLKVASDLVGFNSAMLGEVNESWLEEMQEFYAKLLERKTSWGTPDRKIELFSEPFLFALFRGDSMHSISNVMFHIKAIKETSTVKE